MKSVNRLGLTLALMLALALPAMAQIQGGKITGMIKDEQGGVLPGSYRASWSRCRASTRRTRSPQNRPASSGSSTWRRVRTN